MSAKRLAAAALAALALLAPAAAPAASPPAASTGAASSVGRVSATVNATVNPNGQATTYHFDYGTTTSYGSQTGNAAAGSGTSDQAVSAGLTGLSGSTTYHYRVVATNASGTTVGADRTFRTSAAYVTTVRTAAGLWQYLRLDDVITYALDDIGVPYGTYHGDYVLQQPGRYSGSAISSAGFDGAGYVSVPYSASSTTFSVEGWTNLTSAAATNPSGNNALFGAGGALRLLVRPDGVYAGVWAGGTEYRAQVSTPSNVDTWAHWVLVRDGPTVTVYRNGAAVATIAGLPPDPTTVVGSIAAQGGAAYFLHGRVAEVALYKTALSAATVQSHYTGENGPLGTSGIVHFWRLNDLTWARPPEGGLQKSGYYRGDRVLGQPGALVGDANQSVAFGGAGYLQLFGGPGSTTTFTIEGWTRLTPDAASNPFGYNALYGAGRQVRILVKPDGVYTGAWVGGSEYKAAASTASNIDTWVHWALVRDGSTLTVYRNGQAVASTTGLPTGTTYVSGSLAAQGGTTYLLHGRVDEFAIYTSALSASTVEQHYLVGTGH